MVENKIDLIELFTKIYEKRKFIIIFVSFFTTVSFIYSYTRTPIYEANAVVKFGNYFKYEEKIIKIITMDNKNEISKQINSNNIIDSFTINNTELIDKIKFTYLNKNLGNGKISYIRKNNRVKEYYHIKAQSLSPQDALDTIKIMITNINEELKNEENSLLNRKKNRNKILKNEISLVKDKITSLNRTIEMIKNKNSKHDIIAEYNFSLLMEKYYNSKIELNKLEENKMIIDKELIELSDRNIKLINKIKINNNPIKPNKFKIILMTIISSLFLSLLLLPLLNIIQSRNSK